MAFRLIFAINAENIIVTHKNYDYLFGTRCPNVRFRYTKMPEKQSEFQMLLFPSVSVLWLACGSHNTFELAESRSQSLFMANTHTHTTPALCNSIKWRCVCHKSVLLWWSTSICIAVHLQHFIARPKNNTAIHSILFLFLFVCVCVVLLVRCCQYFGISYLNSYIPEIQCKHITIGCVCVCWRIGTNPVAFVCVCLEYAAHLDFIGQSATHKIRYRIL